MDLRHREYEEPYPRWSRHFAGLAALAAEMFSLSADSAARVESGFLEDPNDEVFTWLLRGFAKSEASNAAAVLDEYLSDEEPWVRRLAERLLQDRTKAQSLHGHPGAAGPTGNRHPL